MRKAGFAALTASLALAACAGASSDAPNPVIEAYVAAYNAHELDEMSARMHPDIEWISLEGSEAIIYTSGKNALIAELKSHFAEPSASTSQLSNWSKTGPYISVTESIRQESAAPGDYLPASLSVYELDGDLIRRVWYYPAVNIKPD